MLANHRSGRACLGRAPAGLSPSAARQPEKRHEFPAICHNAGRRQGPAWGAGLTAMRARRLQVSTLLALLLGLAGAAAGQGLRRITLDEAVQIALEHNHALKAARTLIPQSQAQEITANLRPNPVLTWDAQFLPYFNPSAFSADYINQTAQFDLGIGYLFERGKKRQHRLQAARDLTAVTQSLVADSERALTFNVAQQYVGALLAESNLQLALQALSSFQQTVDISAERYRAGDISEVDHLKIKLQLLQFQTDVSVARLAKAQALASLRQLLGYDAVPSGYDVVGDLDYQKLPFNREDLQAMALRQRPDLRAAQQGIASAQSLHSLAQANGKRDLGASFSYSHIGGLNTGAFFFNIQLPIFDRNQGEIARTRYVINQSQETATETEQTVITDVANAYEGVKTNEQVVQIYQSGYLDQARQSRDISEYAYKRGAASLLDFLDAERSYRATQLAYRQTLASYMLALEQLREAVGTRNLP
jgi:cobalt-zinc-cadmium efflux system outer membrane protein